MYISIYGDDVTQFVQVDLDGKPVRRTISEYPYSYDPYVTWRGDYNKARSHMVYSDRMIQWDHTKFNRCCNQVWNNEGQYFDNRNPKDIAEFLSKYFSKEVKLTAIMEGCNVSNGYPYWIFVYEYDEHIEQ